MSLVDEIARYYAARAAEYDESAGYNEPAAEILREPVKALCRRALAGQDVLEVGCGTGYWTAVIAESVESVLATDITPSMISRARDRLANWSNVRCEVADAYSLDSVRTGFTAAFSMWWWSHMPKARIQDFLNALHRKLVSGAFVFFLDQTPSAYQPNNRRRDTDGNDVEKRCLSDGRQFTVVKNFPTAQEMHRVLKGIAKDVSFKEYPGQHIWSVSYTAV